MHLWTQRSRCHWEQWLKWMSLPIRMLVKSHWCPTIYIKRDRWIMRVLLNYLHVENAPCRSNSLKNICWVPWLLPVNHDGKYISFQYVILNVFQMLRDSGDVCVEMSVLTTYAMSFRKVSVYTVTRMCFWLQLTCCMTPVCVLVTVETDVFLIA